MSNDVPSRVRWQTRGTARATSAPGRKEVVPPMEEHSLGQKLAAEFIGTALLVFVGAGSVPAMILLTSERVAVLRCGGRNGRARVRADRDRDGLLDRQSVGLPHQSGGDLRARRHEALPVERCPGLLGRPRSQVGSPARWRSGRRSESRVFDFGAGFGVVDFNRDVTSWGSAMFVEAWERHPAVRDPRHRRHALARGMGRTRHRPHRRRDHHHGRPDHERLDQSRPRTRTASSSRRPERIVHNWTSSFPAYIPADLAGPRSRPSPTTGSRAAGSSSARSGRP